LRITDLYTEGEGMYRLQLRHHHSKLPSRGGVSCPATSLLPRIKGGFSHTRSLRCQVSSKLSCHSLCHSLTVSLSQKSRC
jgi:hypothetical protein